MLNARIIVALGLATLLACADRNGSPQAGAEPPSRPAAEPPGRPADRRAAEKTIVFLGTSLTAGLGLDPDSAYPAVLQRKIDSAGLGYTVVNAGVSGESSAGALRRIDWLLRQPPAVLVIETGANDGLRGQDPDSIRANLQALVDRARAQVPAVHIVILGMEAMPNLGADYGRRFRAIYPAVARTNQIPLVPFLLAGVGGVDSLNQQDGIHPTAAGARIVADNVWKVLQPMLQ
jgi:acyl-CoA thioesterase-1